jgi:RimJ/RimL family protein N-acetyltransferase
MSRARASTSKPRRAIPPVHIRLLTANDRQAYRALRQRILDRGDGRHFSDSYIREKNLKTDHAWREWCTETPDHCIFGTFDGDELIGILMVTRYDGFGDRTVEWEAVWLDPRYRQLGIARRAYEEAQRWTEAHGYNRVVSFIRADNLRMRHIREKQGARLIATKHDEVWADGSIADVHTFLRDLRPAKSDVKRLRKLHEALRADLFEDDEPRLPDEAASRVFAGGREAV